MRLGDIGQLFDGPHATPERLNEGPYFLNISSLKRGRLDLSQSDHISEEDYHYWTSRVTPRSGDLLFSYETRLGEAALMPKGVRAALGRRMALIRPNRKIVDPIFLLYWYLSPEMQTLIDQRQVLGATVPRILLSELPDWPISLPLLAEQRAIAEVLGALDEKIAVNDRVVAVSNDYRSTLSLLAIDNQKKGVLNDYAALLMRGRAPRYIDSKEGQLVINQKCIRGGQVVLSEARRTSRIETGDRMVSFGDALVNSTGVGTLGRVGIWTAEVDATVDSHVTIVRFPKESFPLCRAQLLVSMQPSIEALAEGSTGQTELGRENLRRMPFYGLNDKAEEIEQKLLNAHLFERAMMTESRTLASLRDTLLPALMNGTLRVKDAEKQASEVL